LRSVASQKERMVKSLVCLSLTRERVRKITAKADFNYGLCGVNYSKNKLRAVRRVGQA